MDELKTDEVNEQIHILMGWKKVECKTTYQCPDGWMWVSPNGAQYEGGRHMVPNYVKKLEEAMEIIEAMGSGNFGKTIKSIKQ